MSDTDECRKCKSEISTEAIACPECGFEPRTDGRLFTWVVVIGGVLVSLTGIGAIIGIPAIIGVLYGEWQQRDAKPTTKEPRN